jgi:hypothetical protein
MLNLAIGSGLSAVETQCSQFALIKLSYLPTPKTLTHELFTESIGRQSQRIDAGQQMSGKEDLAAYMTEDLDHTE